MRNLATIQTIKTLDKIEGKDRILYASFENVGFRVIVSSDMKVCDRVVYCEVDSLLPVRPEFEFLRSRCFADKWNGFRIRNMRMAGLYSEGIVFPLSMFPFLCVKDGTDVTEALGIVKYDPELLEEQQGQKKKSWIRSLIYRNQFLSKMLKWFTTESREWPTWASKSDETRAQNLGYIFEKYQGQEFYSTEKLDGQSCLFGFVKNKFYVCSRNMIVPKKSKQKSNHLEFAKAHDVETRLKKMRKDLGFDFYLQGELCGPGIQGNKYGFTEPRFFVFNMRAVKPKLPILGEVDSHYMSNHAMREYCREYGFEMVPLLESFKWAFKDMTELLAYADGRSWFADTPREGVVIRSLIVQPPDRGQSNMLSLKVISPTFDVKWSK